MHVGHFITPAGSLPHHRASQRHRRRFVHLHQLPVVHHLHRFPRILSAKGQGRQHPPKFVPHRPVLLHDHSQIFIKIDQHVLPRRHPGVFLPSPPVIGLDSPFQHVDPSVDFSGGHFFHLLGVEMDPPLFSPLHLEQEAERRLPQGRPEPRPILGLRRPGKRLVNFHRSFRRPRQRFPSRRVKLHHLAGHHLRLRWRDEKGPRPQEPRPRPLDDPLLPHDLPLLQLLDRHLEPHLRQVRLPPRLLCGTSTGHPHNGNAQASHHTPHGRWQKAEGKWGELDP